MRLVQLLFVALVAIFPKTIWAQNCSQDITVELQIPDGDGSFVVADDLSVAEFFGKAECVCSENSQPNTDFALLLTLNSNGMVFDSDPVDVWVGRNCDTADTAQRAIDCELVETITDINTLTTPTRITISAEKFMFPNENCGEVEATHSVWLLIDDNGGDCDADVNGAQIVFDTEPPPLPTDIKLTGSEESFSVSWDPPSANADDVLYYNVLCAEASNGASLEKSPTIRYELSKDLCGIDDGTSVQSGDASTLPAGIADFDSAFVCGEAAGTQSSVKVSGLENGKLYRVALVAVDEAQNLTAIDLGTIEPVPLVDAWEDYIDSGGDAEGGLCLITTSYGDGGPMTQSLRHFRDTLAANGALGAWLVTTYYDLAPAIISSNNGSTVSYWSTQVVLAPVAVTTWLWQSIPLFVVLMWPVVLFGTRRLRKRQIGQLAVLLVSIAVPAIADDGIDDPETTAEAAVATESAAAEVEDISSETIQEVGEAATESVTDVEVPETTPTYEGDDTAAEIVSKPSPYWDNFDGNDVFSLPVPLWNLALKIGPYHPAIDDEPGIAKDSQGRGPFERMFPGTAPMFQIQLDRFLFHGFGQLGVSATLGYYRNGDNAYLTDAMGNVEFTPEGNPRRSATERNHINLLPTSLGVTYRFTALDDNWGIPLVPYGRAALSYYLWWFRSPNGDLSESPTASCTSAMLAAGDCDGNKGLGGTLGYEVSVGIALRAERIDSGAAANLRNEAGIDHAGFFVELSYAKVDGLGADKKLHVGDATWLAGVNFEF